ncbi:MAG: Holliday junction branch migration protein RuvA, partial [Anaerovoracaceae bacterium]
MIHYLKGTLRLKAEGLVVIEVGGIGYEVFVPAGSNLFLKEEGEAVTVFTSMQVREDDVSLYGFGDEQELFLFKKLITVNSVGAKAALAILSSMPPEEVRRAIIFEDVALLTRANGIGKKTAQKIVLDLKGKLGSLEGSGEPVTLEQRGS